MSDVPQQYKPEPGEQTGKQDGTRASFSYPSDLKGYDDPPAGTIRTYRRMRQNPTLALARIVATMPIRTADIAFETRGNDVPEGVVAFVQNVMEPLWPRLLKDVLTALEFGFAAFEKVWLYRGGRLVYDRLKSLVPETVQMLEDPCTGAFRGVRQGGIDLPPNKCLWYGYDSEAGNPYGRSRNENVRKVWHEWDELVDREGQYATKVSSVIPMIEYPEGKSQDKDGNEVDNSTLAKNVLSSLCSGDGVAMPNVLAQYAHDLVRNGVDISKLKAWTISFLETAGTHAAGLESLLRHKETLMLRGWLVPERSAIEGTHGTLAESEAHADIGVSIAELDLDDILRTVNDYVVNPLLIYNFGLAAKDMVYMSTGGLSSEQKAFSRQIMSTVLTNPANIDLFLKMIDYDALLDQVGLPKSEPVVDIGDWQPPLTQAPMFDSNVQIQHQAAEMLRSIHSARTKG